jgi:uncharacterized protein
MRILIDIGHPAHVHYFRNLYTELAKTHEVTVTCKSMPIIRQLLEHYKIDYIELGSKGRGIVAKAFRQLMFISRIRRLLSKKRIDLAIGVSASVVQACLFSRTKSLLFDDDDLSVQPLAGWFVSPFADCLLAPDVLSYEKLRNAVYYPGYHELAYLHPNRFKPDVSVPLKYGIADGQRYFILRFNAFTAHHDIGKDGMSLEQKRLLVKLLSDFGKVYITTEKALEPEFASFQCPVLPHEMHSFLAYSTLLVSDSQTMTSEAAMLGIPSFRCNSFAGRIAYLDEEERKYDLTFAYLPEQFNLMLDKIRKTLENPALAEQWKEKRDTMLNDKIDVTSFWLWFIENFPASVSEAGNPAFSFGRFR